MFRPRSIGLLLALITLLIYLPATNFHFINFDDADYVTENKIVQNGLTWAGVKWAFSSEHAGNWHPLTWLSHMVDCDLFRLNPAGPHLVNILFHALNTSLLFALFLRLTNKLWTSALIAALFAWHPLHVESVVWIAERKDVLSTFFTLLTLCSYARYVQKRSVSASELNPTASLIRHSLPSIFDYACALFFFALALLSKPMPVTLPLVMLLVDFWPLQRFSITKFPYLLLEKIPFFLLAAASCVVTFLVQHNAESSLENVPFGFRLENAVTAYAVYLWKMIWPTDLAILYPLHAPIAASLIVESIILLVGISIIAWLERKSNPWLIVGWLWFLITLTPVIGLVQVGSQSMADRYSYFPLVGIFLAVIFSMEGLARHFVFLKKWLITAVILILGACITLTENQLHYWHDSEALFIHTLAVTKNNWAIHLSLGTALQDQNRTSEAMTEYILALRLNPQSYMAYGNIAALLVNKGKFEAAAFYCQQALRLSPKKAGYHENLGVAYVKLKRFDDAMKEFSAAAELDITDPEPNFLIGRLLLERGQDADAINEIQKALRLDPNNSEILIYLAGVLASDENLKARNGAEAINFAERVVKLTNGQQPAALDVLAMSYAETGRFNEAVQIQQQAIKFLQANGPQDSLTLMRHRLQLYEKRQPWRESFKEN